MEMAGGWLVSEDIVGGVAMMMKAKLIWRVAELPPWTGESLVQGEVARVKLLA